MSIALRCYALLLDIEMDRFHDAVVSIFCRRKQIRICRIVARHGEISRRNNTDTFL